MRSAKVSADNPSVALRAPAPVVPKAWPPPTKRRWRLGRRSRCPKFFARYRSQNFDRCHSFLLAFSAAGGARNRPRFAKRSPGTRGDPLRLLPVIAKSEATRQSVTPVLSPVRPLSSTIHPPPQKKQSPAPALSCRGGAPFLLGSALRANFLYWISMLVFLGRTFWAALGTDTCRMPFSKLAWMSSGITLSPT